MSVATAYDVQEHLIPALRYLRNALRRCEEEFAGTVKIVRTQLMDATPVTLGQEFNGYVQQMEYSTLRLQAV